jgi:hypothetical protein
VEVNIHAFFSLELGASDWPPPLSRRSTPGDQPAPSNESFFFGRSHSSQDPVAVRASVVNRIPTVQVGG